MPVLAKVAFTCAVGLLAVFFCTVGRTRFSRLCQPDYWSLGEYNPIRWLLFDGDGNVSRTGVLTFYAALLVLVWVT
ncbi:MAG TPA: hypothetical protein VFG04_14350 [Planctomycetaceae bacterium]|jgi:hypothetical protein|nr:hypothetical protein [Planctomycetaceae bacterium]